jgi:hypothetical protein
MPDAQSRQKITFAEMRASGVRGLLVYCSDYRCSHWTAISGDSWPDDVRLSDFEQRFFCKEVSRSAVRRPGCRRMARPKLVKRRGSMPDRVTQDDRAALLADVPFCLFRVGRGMHGIALPVRLSLISAK